MIKPFLLLGFVLLVHCCEAQLPDLKELTGFLDLPANKLEAHLLKKGFKKNLFGETSEPANMLVKEEKTETKKNTRCFQITNSGKATELIYETTSEEEYKGLISEIKKAGYGYPSTPHDSNNMVYQRHNICFESSMKTSDSTLFYVLKAIKKELPRKKDIIYAEDLLLLDGHEYLVDVFGRENVKADVFYYSETEKNLCSVLFPNTNRQVVFVWNDETNLKNISFILIGGDPKLKDAVTRVAVSSNTWISRQGIYCGMNLVELQNLNKESLRFYNWNQETAGHLAPDNKGQIDFSQLKLVFNCMNCSFQKLSDREISDSGYAIENDQKVYVASLILMPDRKVR
jgi:hypothetical protein